MWIAKIILRRLSIQIFNKGGIFYLEEQEEVSMEPPQYNGGLLCLQKREYLAKRETQFSKEFIVDMVFTP
jgi:hypothetical protein